MDNNQYSVVLVCPLYKPCLNSTILLSDSSVSKNIKEMGAGACF